jgi:hypothetical protein
MRLKTPPAVASVEKREDKTEMLRAYFAHHLRALRPETLDSTLTVVAASAESPVARALVELGTDIAAAGVKVRAIFHVLAPESTPIGWTISGPTVAFERDIRWARNARLADAHEQLVLGTEAAWIGDCMRRDANRRDAYEQRVEGDAATVRILQRSFERLWGVSEPLAIRFPIDAGIAAAVAVTCGEAAFAASANGEAGPSPERATR